MGDEDRNAGDPSKIERERRRFENWAAIALTGSFDRSQLFARARGGAYILPAVSTAWAAWQARGLFTGGWGE